MGKDSILLIDGSSMLATNYYGNMPKEILFEKDREKQKDMYDLILKDSKGRYYKRTKTYTYCYCF